MWLRLCFAVLVRMGKGGASKLYAGLDFFSGVTGRGDASDWWWNSKELWVLCTYWGWAKGVRMGRAWVVRTGAMLGIGLDGVTGSTHCCSCPEYEYLGSKFSF